MTARVFGKQRPGRSIAERFDNDKGMNMSNDIPVFVPSSNSRQQQLIADYLYGGLKLEYTLDRLQKECQRITDSTRKKLEAVAAGGNGLAKKLMGSLPVERMNGRPLQTLIAVATWNVSLKQAANRLHVSLDTANKHIAAAKAYLGAKTTAHAVFRGIKEGLIAIDNCLAHGPYSAKPICYACLIDERDRLRARVTELECAQAAAATERKAAKGSLSSMRQALG